MATITGGPGDDPLLGDSDGSDLSDSIFGLNGNDTLSGRSGNDSLYGGVGNDSLLGGIGNDLLDGNAGNDILIVDSGSQDTVYGGDGNDIIKIVGGGSATIAGGAGYDVVDLSGVTSFWQIRGLADEPISIEKWILTRFNDTLDGQGAADSFEGGSGRDVLRGGAGSDTMRGQDGDDFLVGEDGDDTLDGGLGFDRAYWDSSEDAVTANLVTNIATVGGFRDTLVSIEGLIGGLGDDRLTGNNAANDLFGNAGGDSIQGGGGADNVGAGADDDTIRGDAGSDTLFGEAGNDSATGGTEGDFLNGGAGLDTLFGEAGNDKIDGGADNDRIYGGDGNDTINGLLGADTIEGGDGDDVYTITAATTIIEVANPGIDTVYAGFGYTLAANLENLILIGDATVGGGNAVANRIVAGARAASLAGAGGNDTLLGGTLNDTLNGGSEADSLDGGLGADSMSGGTGNDVYLVENAGDGVFEGGNGGTDTVRTTIAYALAARQQVEQLVVADAAAANAIDLTGNEFANTLRGNAGRNVLNGGANADQMFGYGGDDDYHVDNGGDRAFEAIGDGIDRVIASIGHTLLSGQEIERLVTSDARATGSINLTGNEFANIIEGNAGQNVLDGARGADTLTGFAGNDTYRIDDSGDRIIEAAGGGNDRVLASTSYALQADQEVEQLFTSSPNATAAIDLTGNAIANVIQGNAGTNAIAGGLGRDVLTGGGGADSFVFDTALGTANIDVVTDFASGTDRIVLGPAVFAALPAGALQAAAFKDLSRGATDADDRILYNAASGALFYDADGSGAGAAIQFVTLQQRPTITHEDFVIG